MMATSWVFASSLEQAITPAKRLKTRQELVEIRVSRRPRDWFSPRAYLSTPRAEEGGCILNLKTWGHSQRSGVTEEPRTRSGGSGQGLTGALEYC